jgi:hypothetical protein
MFMFHGPLASVGVREEFASEAMAPVGWLPEDVCSGGCPEPEGCWDIFETSAWIVVVDCSKLSCCEDEVSSRKDWEATEADACWDWDSCATEPELELPEPSWAERDIPATESSWSENWPN